MKKLILTVLGATVLAVAVGAAFSEDTPTSGPSQRRGLLFAQVCRRIADRLNMTQEQRSQAREILQAAHQEAKDLQGADQKREVWKAAFAKIRTTILTEDQRKQLADLKAKWQERCKVIAGEDKGGS